MTVQNPSFEVEGAPLGEPDGWVVQDDTAYVEVAEFGDNLGFDRFEIDWRLPLGLNLKLGDLTAQNIWASVLNNVPTIEDAPSSDAVVNPSVVIITGIVPVGGAVLTLTYINEDLDSGRTATAVLPEGAVTGTEYPLVLEADDLGFTEITGISTSPILPATELAILGSWYLAPRNEASKFAFDEEPGVDTFPFSINGNPFEGYEAGWLNDGGFRNNFDALLQAAAVFDTEELESFEDSWKLPASPSVTPFNENLRLAHHNFIDGEPVTIEPFTFSIVTDVNDIVAIDFTEFGTTGVLTVQLDSGNYTAAALAAELQTKVRAALDADLGDTVGTDFSTSVLSDGRIRVSTDYAEAGSTRGTMRLVAPATFSAWPVMGLVTGKSSERSPETETLEVGSASPESFESDWKNNQLFVSSLPDDANGVISAADFGGPAPNTPEQFESGWVLTLP